MGFRLDLGAKRIIKTQLTLRRMYYGNAKENNSFVAFIQEYKIIIILMVAARNVHSPQFRI